MTIGTVEIVLGDAEYEKSYIRAMATQSIQAGKAMFLGRFLTDLSLSDEVLLKWKHSNIVLRQYGNSCHVNACLPLADAGRIDIGMEESENALQSKKYDLVLLSQILIAVDEDLLTTADILSLIYANPANVRLILTGRNAPAEIASMFKTIKQGY
jgi:ATP:corrinoid adenosyltransferase